MDNNHQVRAIVPGHLGKSNTATLRPVVVERLNNEGPIALGNAAVKRAEKTFKGFHAIYSGLHVMVALPEAEPDPIFEGLWQMLMLPDSEKVILTVITTNSDGAQMDIETRNLPYGWRWEWMETGPGDEPREDDEEPDPRERDFDAGTPYNNTNHL